MPPGSPCSFGDEAMMTPRTAAPLVIPKLTETMEAIPWYPWLSHGYPRTGYFLLEIPKQQCEHGTHLFVFHRVSLLHHIYNTYRLVMLYSMYTLFIYVFIYLYLHSYVLIYVCRRCLLVQITRKLSSPCPYQRPDPPFAAEASPIAKASVIVTRLI